MTLVKPKNLILQLTNQCNAFCKTCNASKNIDIKSLDTYDCLNIIKNFSILSPNGLIILTGGEPLIDLNKIISILTLCNNINMKVQLETNGINFIELYKQQSVLLNNTIRYLKLSLNSVDKEIHNSNCGINNSFEIQHQIIDLIKKDRPNYNDPIKLWCHSILCDYNIDTFINTYNYSKDLFDQFSFDLMYTKLGEERENINPFDQKEKIIMILNYIILHCNKGKKRYLINNNIDIEDQKKLILNGNLIKNNKCTSPLNNIMISNYGYITLCWDYYNQTVISDFNYIGNIKDINLIELYNSIKFKQYREELYNTCNKWCGIKHCHSTP
jgi:MoaA/NifB/PqqE/SkfB family radical SAM enzyme